MGVKGFWDVVANVEERNRGSGNRQGRSSIVEWVQIVAGGRSARGRRRGTRAVRHWETGREATEKKDRKLS